MRQNVLIAPAVAGVADGTPLGHAAAVAVAVDIKDKAVQIGVVADREALAAQAAPVNALAGQQILAEPAPADGADAASGPTCILATQPYWLADWIVNQLLGSTPDRSMSITSRMRSCSVWREKRAVPLELPFVFQWLDTLWSYGLSTACSQARSLPQTSAAEAVPVLADAKYGVKQTCPL